jgi:hypothetical protein
MGLIRECINNPKKILFNNGMVADETELSGPQPPGLGSVGSKTILRFNDCFSTVRKIPSLLLAFVPPGLTLLQRPPFFFLTKF